MMSVYRICEECGAALDPGERCDCRPVVPLRLIQSEAAKADVPPRYKRVLNTGFTGPWYVDPALARGDQP